MGSTAATWRACSPPPGGRSRDATAAAPAAALGSGPRRSRFSSYAAALRARPRRPAEVVGAGTVRAFLAPCRSGCCARGGARRAARDARTARGIRTLGELAALPVSAMSERFGHPGLLALDLAPAPQHPARAAPARRAGGGAAGAARGHVRPAAEHALELLIRAPPRSARAARALAALAGVVGEASWKAAPGAPRITLRQASADPGRLKLVLVPKLSELRRPPRRWSGGGGDRSTRASRRGSWTSEVRRKTAARASGRRCARRRQAAGAEAALRVLPIDPDSRLPERRAVLAPFPAEPGERKKEALMAGVRRLAFRAAPPWWPARAACRRPWPQGRGRGQRGLVVEDRRWTGRPLRRRYSSWCRWTGRHRRYVFFEDCGTRRCSFVQRG